MKVLDKTIDLEAVNGLIKIYIDKIENTTNLSIEYGNNNIIEYGFLKIKNNDIILYNSYNSIDVLLSYLQGLYHTIYDIKVNELIIK